MVNNNYNKDQRRYLALDLFLKKEFGQKVYRISLDGGMTCPNRDGTIGFGGCIFCSEGGSGDFAGDRGMPVSKQLEIGKSKLKRKTDCSRYIAYFQAFTNTYASVEYLSKIFHEAISDPEVVILSIATRPDCLSEEILILLDQLNKIKPVWVELGLQTIHEETSKLIRRGFDLECFDRAVLNLKKHGLTVISHIILGLPGETKEDMIETVDHVSELGVDGIKLQLLHVLKGTDLAKLYEESGFPVFEMEDYCRFVGQLVARLPEDMVVHRITGDGPKDLLIAPVWSRDKKRVLNTIHKIMREEDLWQGKLCPYNK